jgi:hypothetical protein
VYKELRKGRWAQKSASILGDGQGLFRAQTTEADEGNRTPNLLITNQLLCQLSYVSLTRSKRQTSRPNIKCACYHCSNPSYSFSHTTVQA